MIAGDHHHMPAAGGGDPAEEAVVQFLGAVAGHSAVKDIARHQHSLYPALFDDADQPIQKGGKLSITLFAMQAAAQVPVGSMEDNHGCF